jgi:hypothetical protein
MPKRHQSDGRYLSLTKPPPPPASASDDNDDDNDDDVVDPLEATKNGVYGEGRGLLAVP